MDFQLPDNPTLEDYAKYVMRLTNELQINNNGYARSRELLSHIKKAAADPTYSLPADLPSITVKFADGPYGPYTHTTLHLSTLTRGDIQRLESLFEYLIKVTGTQLLNTWEALHEVTNATQPLVAAIRQSAAE